MMVNTKKQPCCWRSWRQKVLQKCGCPCTDHVPVHPTRP